MEDPELNLVTLYLIDKIIDLGDYFKEGEMTDGRNVFIEKIEDLDIKRAVDVKSYSQNNEISKLSLDIIDKI